MRRIRLSLLALASLAVSSAAWAESDNARYAAAYAPEPQGVTLNPGLTATAPAAESPRVRGRRAAAATPRDANQYFVEFRSRHALSYGHTFLVHGRLNAKGEVGQLSDKNVAGFHPAGAGPELWSLGHLVPVTAETGPSDGDLEEEYVSARYRVILTEAEYRKVRDYIHQKQRASTPWHAAIYNCNAWVGDVARFMGLKTPLSHWLLPAEYINGIRQANS